MDARIRREVYPTRPFLQAMDHKAALLALVLVSSSLAGCTGDPGEGGGDEFDSEALQDLIDENLQDFMNNTSITVNNHFYNNTTVVNNDYNTNNDYNNTTNVDGGEINNYNQFNGTGAGFGSVMNMFTVSWDWESDLIGYDPLNVIVFFGNNTNDPTLFYADYYNGQVIEFRISCLEYLNFDRLGDWGWNEWLVDNYGNSSGGSSSWNVAQSIDNHFDSWGNDVEEFCHIQDPMHIPIVVLFEIDLAMGEAMSIQVLPNHVTVDLNCDDGYGTGLGNGTSTEYIGGQANCTVTGSTDGYWMLYVSEWLLDENGENVDYYGSNIYDWFVKYDIVAPENFAVYFTMHYVEVYDLDSE